MVNTFTFKDKASRLAKERDFYKTEFETLQILVAIEREKMPSLPGSKTKPRRRATRCENFALSLT